MADSDEANECKSMQCAVGVNVGVRILDELNH